MRRGGEAECRTGRCTGGQSSSRSPASARRARIRYRGKELAALEPLAALGEKAGDVVTIVGSGPSMRGVDLARLPGFPILLNGAVSLGLAGAVAVEDERFAWRHLAMLKERVTAGMPRLFSPAVIRVLAARAPMLVSGGPVILMENLEKPAGLVRRRDLGLVSERPEEGVIVAGTVAFSVMQVALGLPARRILFAGVDLGNAAAPRFYETAGDMAPSGLLTGLDRILRHFRAGLELAERRGIVVETVTPGSALERIGVPYRPL
jgi:hypothetical protein